jgi:hypothetical protein
MMDLGGVQKANEDAAKMQNADAAEAPQQAAASHEGGRRERPSAGLPKEYVANMLGAISALHQHEK